VRPIGDVSVEEIGILMGGLHDQAASPATSQAEA